LIMLCKRLWAFAAGSLLLTGMLHAQEGANIIEIGGRKAHATRIIVRLQDGAGTAVQALTARPAAKAMASAAGLEVRKDLSFVPGLMVLDEPKDAFGVAAIVAPETRAQMLEERMQFLRDSGQFAYVEPDYVLTAQVTPNDLRFTDGTLWGLNNSGQQGGTPGADIDAVRAWDITTGSKSVVVAVIDTGIRYTHRDLSDNIWTNPGEIPGNGIDDDGNGYVDDVHGINSITGSGDPFDDGEHGTHVSGTIGAVANNGEPHVGVSWQVSLMGLKFLGADGSGFTSDAIECIQYAVRMKVPISNNSWGGSGGDQALADALAMARDAGHLFIAAAGNGGADGVGDDNGVTFVSPASYALENMVVVAAINRKDRLAGFSNYGLRTVHLGAPGVEIYSSVSTSDTAYDVFQGTSMACPHVTGVAALALAAHPTASMTELRLRLLNSAVPTAALTGKTITGGRVNAFRAVTGDIDGKIDQLAIAPPDGSTVLVTNTTPVLVTVTDLFPLTNATVSAVINGPGFTNASLAFTNNGVKPDAVALDGTYSANFLPQAVGTYQMVISATAPGKTGITNTVNYLVVARPSNDRFAAPRKIAAGGETITDEDNTDTTLTTFEPGEPAVSGVADGVGSLWFAWTPTVSSPVLLDTFGTRTPVAFAVYTGTSFLNLKLVGSAVPVVPKSTTSLTFNATKGVTYRIAVIGFGDSGKGQALLRLTPNGLPDVVAPLISFSSPANGYIASNNVITVSGIVSDPTPYPTGVRQVLVNGQNATLDGNNWSATISLSPGLNTVSAVAQDYAENVSSPSTLSISLRLPSVVNDQFVNATVLSDVAGTVTGDNTLASREFGEPVHGGSAGGHSIWWNYTATSDGVLSLSTTNSAIDTLLGVYSGARVGSLTTLASNDDAYPSSSFSAATVPLRKGQTAHIAVDGFAGAVGSISLTYTFTPATLFTLTVQAGAGGSVSSAGGLFASNAPVSLTATAATYYNFDGWSGSVKSSANPLSFLISSNMTVTANFVAIPFTDDFETGNLSHAPWVTAGDVPWTVQSNTVASGEFAAQAGKITDSQVSSLRLAGVSLGGEGAFAFKASSESGWDYLEFYHNGSLVQRWSGEVDWTTFTFAIAAGQNDFEWRYVKDAGNSGGQDTAWLDNVQLYLRPPTDDASKATVKFLGFDAGNAKIQVQGQVNQSYIIQYSSNLKGWSPISTVLNTNGTFTVSDPDSTDKTPRFYRAIVAP
jgi:subtilisin family serine protease